ncbi:LapA family protein [Myxacorys almedinensis]|uniref:DUF1049 domain-containing protein n=1 Tax=Myxacorys almedinensis A TaxID=2690445 RepID=A0A8J7Z1X4_9CYAN|nr:LapA family protein [Myxacorys almedinensis]NDJ18144.1 DUF1049 domain-containing protein [Myxacorys almedinensis A]
MQILTLLALLIAIVAVVFALQNSAPIAVQFLGWQSQDSLALILLLTFTFGVLVGLLISLPPFIKRLRRSSHLKHRLHERDSEIEELHRQLVEARQQLNALPPSQPRYSTQLQSEPQTKLQPSEYPPDYAPDYPSDSSL